MDVEVVEARACHLPRTTGIQDASTRSDARMGIQTSMSEAELRDLVGDDDVPFLVAKRGGAVVGYACGLIGERRCLLDQIAVAPEARGGAAAGDLLEGVEDAARAQVDSSVAKIIGDNLRSQRFFKRSGYVLDSVRVGPRSQSWQIWVKSLAA